ncbi:540_t:CDS:1 [Ambispora gerdemannii]|uniref:540_t:CDS:1 n=1 Tax=Ambispora gerdemannii TaxID=144530 RepID=A0A9N9G0I9_9GLOM|nr:540_t:CDS:1 [Ambispora gerdemannii]
MSSPQRVTTPQSGASDYCNTRDTPQILRTRNLDSPLLLNRQDIGLNNISPIVLHKVQQLSFLSTCLVACQDEEEPDNNYTDGEYDDENIPPLGYDVSAKPFFDPRLKSSDREPLAELDLRFYKNSHQCLLPPNQLRKKKIHSEKDPAALNIDNILYQNDCNSDDEDGVNSSYPTETPPNKKLGLTPDNQTKDTDSEIKEKPIPIAIFTTPIESTSKESCKTDKIKRKIRTPGSSKPQSVKSESDKLQNSPFFVWEDPNLEEEEAANDQYDNQEESNAQDNSKKMEIYDSPFVRRLRSVIFEEDDDDKDDSNSDYSISHLIDQSTPTRASNNQKSPLASLTPIAAKSIFWNEDS